MDAFVVLAQEGVWKEGGREDGGKVKVIRRKYQLFILLTEGEKWDRVR